jgi:hypothetical protein
MNPRHPKIALRAGGRCEYCHAPESAFNLAFEVEHIFPSVHGGSDAEENLALSCHACNAHKSMRVDGIDPDDETVVRLFHPRQDNWDQHFFVDTETAFVHGLTPTGRATVAGLNMNSVVQRTARRQWMRLNLIP